MSHENECCSRVIGHCVTTRLRNFELLIIHRTGARKRVAATVGSDERRRAIVAFSMSRRDMLARSLELEPEARLSTMHAATSSTCRGWHVEVR